MYLTEQLVIAPFKLQRRRYARIQVQCRARILIGSRHYAGYLDNISRGGARLRTISAIRRLGTVMLRLPDMPQLRCHLCWMDAYNAGVEFETALPAAELHEWLSSRLASASLQSKVAELLELAD